MAEAPDFENDAGGRMMTTAMATILLVALTATVVGVGLGLRAPEPPLTPSEEADEARDYQEVRGVMSRAEFHAIRAKNRHETETFGDGSFAPYWPRRDSNGHYTLRRGVWVDDFARRPTNAELDAVREHYRREHEQVTFTLVEGR